MISKPHKFLQIMILKQKIDPPVEQLDKIIVIDNSTDLQTKFVYEDVKNKISYIKNNNHKCCTHFTIKILT